MSQLRSKSAIKPRNGKINSRQKKILLQYLADNPSVYHQRTDSNFSLYDHAFFWEKIGNVLNLFGPPRKTAATWKKAWKDIKLRYTRGGIDVRGIVQSLMLNPIINTQYLSNRATEIKDYDDKIDATRLLEECAAHNRPLVSSHQMYTSFEKIGEDSSKYDRSKTLDFAHQLGLSNFGEQFEGDIDDIEKVRSEDYCEELLLSLEQVEDSNDTLQMEVTLKKDLLEREEEIEDEIESPARKQRKLDSTDEFGEILDELRSISKSQRDQYNLQKDFIDYQKIILQQTLNVQKDLAKSQNILANCVKRLVDNISFNS